jgi:nucleolar protein 56
MIADSGRGVVFALVLVLVLAPATAPLVAGQSDDTVTLTVEHDGTRLGETSIQRTPGRPAVEPSRVETEEFVGWITEPPERETAPAVIVLHGSGGQPLLAPAQQLASHGFVTLALKYFDWQGTESALPTELAAIPLEYVASAAEWLLDDSRVTGQQVGVYGVSKGGELALVTASEFETIGPTVSVNGSGIVWEGVGQQLKPGSSWSKNGDPVPYVPYPEDPSVWDTSAPAELRPGYEAAFTDASESEIEEATVPVEQIAAPVLLVSGGQDRLWNSVEYQGIAAERLAAHDREHEHLVYEDAGHGLRYPYVPTANRAEGQ